MREDSPCRFCTEKYTACHDHCDKYKEWKVRYQAQQKHLEEGVTRNYVPMTEARAKAYLKYPLRNNHTRTRGGSDE